MSELENPAMSEQRQEEKIETRGSSRTLHENERPSSQVDGTTDSHHGNHGGISFSVFVLWLRQVQKCALFQLALSALLCFLGPGMWNALNGIGGAGLVDAGPANEANMALYTTLALSGFFGGIFLTRIGFRWSFFFGELGYAFYSGSTLAYKHIHSRAYLVAAGTQLGITAGWLWTAQTATLSTYPTDEGRGRAVAFWGLIYNLGACIGSLVSAGGIGLDVNRTRYDANTLIQVAFLQNQHSTAGQVDDTTSAVLISMSVLGALLALLVLPAKDVVRTDGTQVEIPKSPTWKEAALGFAKCLRREPYLVLILPMYFASNFFYPYQFNTFNLNHFNIRSRSLNNIIYWMSEIVGALCTGSLLDMKHSRFNNDRQRAMCALLALLLFTCVVWTGALLWQHTIAPVTEVMGKLDYTDSYNYATGAVLYAGFGLLAASYQAVLLW